MKSFVKIASFSIIIIITSGCCSIPVSISNYDKIILQNTVTMDIPQLQADTEKKLFMDHKIKSMSFVMQRENEVKLDSLTFLEFDFSGRLKYRTTIENTTQGCLPFMLKQEFIYDKNKLKKVIDYTFKYKTKSVLANWLEKDTTRLRLFDWEDYTYKGDTIIVNNGNSITKFIKDKVGNIIYKIQKMKSNNQIQVIEYEYSGTSIISKIQTSLIDVKNVLNYFKEDNNVIINTKREDDEFKKIYVYNKDGLLQSIIRLKNGIKTSITRINYEYYF